MTHPQHNTPTFSSRHRRAIIISVMAAAALYLLAVISTGYEQAWQAITRMGWQGWSILLVCSFLSYLVRYARWQYFLRLAGWTLPHRLHLLYYLAGFALTTTPGKAGETIRSVLLHPHGVPYHTSLATFFSERLLDVLVIAILASLILITFSEHLFYVLLAGLLLFSVLPILQSSVPDYVLNYLNAHVHRERLRHIIQHMVHLLRDAQHLLSSRPLYTGFTLGLLAWTIQGLAFYYILLHSGFETRLSLALGIYALSLLAGAVSMIPGGLGSTELAMGLLLAAAGAEQHAVLTIPVISRLGTLWFAVLLGFAAGGLLSLRGTRPQN